jgi:predicted metal-binding protein
MKPIGKIDTLIKQTGFKDYHWIDPSEIVVAQWVRVKCMFGCSDYGLGTCPPNTPSVDDCRKFFREYKHGIIIPLKIFADKNNYPSDWSREMTDKLLLLEKDIFLSGYPKTFLLNQTCCSVCKECPGNRTECKDKSHSRPSPESFAVDVYETIRNVGIEIHVIKESPSDIMRIAILLID